MRGEPFTSPETARDGTLAVLLDGALDNRAEIASDLAARLPRGPIGDAALVLHAYRLEGERVLARLRGTFAVLVHDAERDVLLAARDPMGIYPLFYAEAGRRLLLSTTIDDLLGHPEVPRTLNRPAIADDLSFRWPDPGETYFAAVRRVPPGHVLRAGQGPVEVYGYWDPAPVGDDFAWARPEEVGRFDELLERAIERCLRSAPAAIFLSGGLDSVSVAAVAADLCRRAGEPLPLALSLAFPHPDCNEEAVQRSVARELGLPQVVLPFGEAVGPAGLLRAALERTRTLPTPLVNLWSPAYVRLAGEAVQRGRPVVLTGGGGDEWLTVSPYYAADLLETLDAAGLYRLWDSLRHSFPGSGPLFLCNVVWRFGLRALAGERARRALARVAPDMLRRRWRRHVRLNTPAWVARDPALRRELERRHASSMERPAPRSLYLRSVRYALDSPLVSMEKEEIFEIGRRNGFREVMPYWDADLVALLYRAPVEILNRGGRSKGLVRQSVAQRFPALGFDRQRKVAATAFYRSVLRTEGPPIWQSLGGVRALSDLGIVDPVALAPFVATVLSGGLERQSHRIWQVIKLEAWARSRL
jgi:asparagine synthase (glutamine-hydrolysing)